MFTLNLGYSVYVFGFDSGSEPLGGTLLKGNLEFSSSEKLYFPQTSKIASHLETTTTEQQYVEVLTTAQSPHQIQGPTLSSIFTACWFTLIIQCTCEKIVWYSTTSIKHETDNNEWLETWNKKCSAWYDDMIHFTGEMGPHIRLTSEQHALYSVLEYSRLPQVGPVACSL